MKFLILILISTSSFAGNYFPVGKDGAKTTYAKKQLCELREGQKCFNIKGKRAEFYKVVESTEEVDNKMKPIYAQNKGAISCDGVENCSLKVKESIDQKRCEQYGEGYFPMQKEAMVVCAKIESYEKRTIESSSIVIDESVKSEIEAIEAADKTEKEGVEKELRNQKVGQKLYALIKHVQKKKGLTKAQRKALRISFKEIKTMLLDGDLELAKDELSKISPDGVLVTDLEINSLVDRINKHLGE